MLSIENYNKINKNGLYKSKPFGISLGSDPYWCKNWTFKVKECKGILYMVDTYFNDRYIEVTDENIVNFKFQFEFDDVNQVSVYEYDKYEDEDRWIAAIGSGGWLSISLRKALNIQKLNLLRY